MVDESKYPLCQVVVESSLIGIRQRAMQGNLDSMSYLAICVQRGDRTPKNPELALQMFDLIIAQRDTLPHKETYWRALSHKSHLLWDRGDEAAIDAIAIETIRHMAQYDSCQWDREIMAACATWLVNRQAYTIKETE